ncbi:MAG: 5'/3'-nucleotidase SurE [Huintestinicola sp.]
MNKKILITNDDGIDASGIIRLAAAAVRYGEVWVVAPESQRSAASHSITLRSHIDVYEHFFPVDGVKAYAISGTPGDCVRIGIHNIMPEKPDIVLSGINYGYNAGSDVQYSATVGAAMEAVFQGIAAVAFSEGTNDGYMITDKYLDAVLSEVINTPFTEREIININFPTCKPEEFKGILRDRFNSSGCIFRDRYDSEKLPDGGIRYRVNGIYNEDCEEGSDLRALFDKYISIGTVTNIH